MRQNLRGPKNGVNDGDRRIEEWKKYSAREN
jgi:hypothetical protein